MLNTRWHIGKEETPRVSFALGLLGLSLLGLSLLAADRACAQSVADGYAVKPGDKLHISVWREEDLQLEVLVRPDGGISLPLAGDIPARGMTVEQLRREIVERLERYIPDPEVAVAVAEIRGNTIFVLGKVARPGEFVLSRDLDVMQALSMAGGTTTYAKLNDIKILRRAGESQTAIRFRYGDMEEGRNLEQNVLLQNGDVVLVP